jgi:hypothetical protein
MAVRRIRAEKHVATQENAILTIMMMKFDAVKVSRHKSR